ncbi:MAG TPA: sulfite exporter TauE/SafE family protein [Kofleriaceae bacterium]
MDAVHLALVGAAALAGGAVNAIAGGGSLITFPTLVACHVDPILASAINTVALCPGYLGAALAQKKDMAGQRTRAVRILPAAAVGGVAGAYLLMHTSASAFDVVVPFLLLAAVVLLGVQDRLRAWLAQRAGHGRSEVMATVLVALASIYGGYFGAGLGIIVLAVLGVVVEDTFNRLNAFKQFTTLVVNVTAAVAFVLIAPLDWTVVLVMAVTSLIGGVIGGSIASRVSAKLLRAIVMIAGSAVSAVYFAKLI